jgi:hypothetical protein
MPKWAPLKKENVVITREQWEGETQAGWEQDRGGWTGRMYVKADHVIEFFRDTWGVVVDPTEVVGAESGGLSGRVLLIIVQ